MPDNEWSDVTIQSQGVDTVQAQPKENKQFCRHCGTQIPVGSAFCPSCGKPQTDAVQPVGRPLAPPAPAYEQPVQQPVYAAPVYQQPLPQQAAQNSTTVIVNSAAPSNGLGTAGFALSLIALLVCWVPVVDVILWFLGLIFSMIGVFKAPRGLAIAGLILSLVDMIILVTIFGALIGLASGL